MSNFYNKNKNKSEFDWLFITFLIFWARPYKSRTSSSHPWMSSLGSGSFTTSTGDFGRILRGISDDWIQGLSSLAIGAFWGAADWPPVFVNAFNFSSASRVNCSLIPSVSVTSSRSNLSWNGIVTIAWANCWTSNSKRCENWSDPLPSVMSLFQSLSDFNTNRPPAVPDWETRSLKLSPATTSTSGNWAGSGSGCWGRTTGRLATGGLFASLCFCLVRRSLEKAEGKNSDGAFHMGQSGTAMKNATNVNKSEFTWFEAFPINQSLSYFAWTLPRRFSFPPSITIKGYPRRLENTALIMYVQLKNAESKPRNTSLYLFFLV